MPEGLVHLPLHMEWFMQGGATVRNPCFYGSGEKYKNRHGQMIEEFLQAGHRDRGFA
jgi:hypothetical protein